MPTSFRHALTPAQRSIVDAALLDPDSDVFVVADRLDINGRVDLDLFARALEQTGAETETLGLRVDTDGEEPRRRMVPARLTVQVEDVTHSADPESAAETLLNHEMSLADAGLPGIVDAGYSARDDKPVGNPAGALLVRVDETRAVGVLRFHHVAMDGYAITLFVHRAAQHYRALMAGEEIDELPRAFEEFVDEQCTLSSDGGNDPEILALADRVHAALGSDGTTPTISGRTVPGLRPAHRCDVALDPDTQEAVRDLCASDRSITWADVYTALWAAFTARVAATSSVVLGVPFSGRTTALAVRTPGMAVTVLPLPVHVDLRRGIGDLARQVSNDLAMLRRHQHVRGESLAAAWRIPSLLRGPGINLKPYTRAMNLGEAAATTKTHRAGPVDDVDLSVTREELTVEANPDAYSEAEAGFLARRFAGFVTQAMSDPRRPIGQVAALELHGEVADASEPLPQEGFDVVDVSDALAAVVAARPREVAVRCGAEVVTFAELSERVRTFSAQLVACGAGPESVVAIALERSIDVVVATLATLEAGAAITPIDLEYPDERISYLLEDAEPCVVVTRANTRVAQHPRALVVDRGIGQDHRGEPGRTPRRTRSVERSGEHLAYVVYTSGSTGRPKGVAVNRGSLAFFLAHHAATLFEPTARAAGRRLRAAHTASFSFDSSWEQLLWLLLGHELVIFDEDERRDARAVVEAIDDLGIDALDVTPSFAAGLLEAGLLTTRHTPELFLIGGEGASPELWRRLAAAEMHSHNYYGPTEATVDALGADVVGESPSIGRALAGTDALVLDTALQPVPVGVVGELYLAGPHVARGYRNRSGLTASRFVADPRGGGSRAYRTGDLVRVEADGRVTALGRADDQVKIRGHRVELGELEQALLAIDGVTQAAAVTRGKGTATKLVAYVVTGASVELTPDELLEVLRQTVPEHLVPHAAGVLDALPLTVNGKLDVAALPEITARSDGGARPSDEREVAVCTAVADVLGLDEVAADVEFVSLGADSISAISIVGTLRRAGWVTRPRELFSAPTAQQLAPLLVALAADEEQASLAETTLEPYGRTPRTPIVAALEQAAPSLHAIAGYAQSFVVPSRGVDMEAVEELAEALVRHHPVLGMTVREERPGQPWTLDIPEAPEVPEVFVGEVTTLRERVVSALDPSRGRMLALGLDLGTEQIVLGAHHLVIDAVSWRILAREIEVVLESGKQLTAVDGGWRRRAIELEALEPDDVERTHWERLRNVECAVFRDHAGSARVREARRVVRRLGSAHAEAVMSVLPQHLDARPDTVLAGILVVALQRWRAAAEGELLLTWETHGRDSLTSHGPGAEGVGWFTTEFPVAIELPTFDDPADCLSEAVRAAREARMQVPRDGLGAAAVLGSETPRPGVLLNYLGRFDGLASETEGSEARPSLSVHLPDDLVVAHPLEVAVFVLPDDAGLDVEFTMTPEVAEHADALFEAWDTTWETVLDLLAISDERQPGTLIPAQASVAGLTLGDVRRLEASAGPLLDVAPLSPLQEGLVFHALKDANDDVYLTSTTVGVETVPDESGTHPPLDPERVAEAVRATIQDFPQLGASFVVGVTSEPVQVVPLRPRTDVRVHVASDGGEELIRQLRESDLARPMPVDAAPLLRAHVVHTSLHAARIVIVAHHLLLDGWSTPLFLDRIFERLSGGDDTFVRRGVFPSGWWPTRDAIRAQLDIDDVVARQAWQEHLRDLEVGSCLGRTSDGGSTNRAAGMPKAIAIPLEPAERHAVLSVAREAGVTVSTLLGGAWALVLGRVLGTGDVVFGMTTSGRALAGEAAEEAIGLLSTTVPSRWRLTPDEPFVTQLRRAQRERAALNDVESFPLAEIEAGVGIGTLFDTLVVVENYPQGAQGKPGGVRMTSLEASGSTHYAACLTVLPGDDLSIQLEHDPGRISPTRASALAYEVAETLRALSRQLDRSPLSLTATMSSVEPLRGELPATTSGGEGISPLRSVVAAAAAEPEAPAVHVREVSWSRRDLVERAGGLQRALETVVADGPVVAGSEAVVAVALPRGFEAVAALVACLAAGLPYLPIDMDWPPERLRDMFDDAGVVAVVASEGSDAAMIGRDLGIVIVDPAGCAGADLALRDRPRLAAAYIIYTSGSTGRPKGVVCTRAALENHFEGLRTGRHADLVARLRRTENRERVRAVHSASLAFDTSLVQLHWLFAGHELIVLDEEQRRDPTLFAQAAADADSLDVAPVLAEQLVAVGLFDGPRPVPDVFLGGEAVNEGLWTALRERAATTRASNLYGPTETTVDALGQTVGDSSAPIVGEPVAGIIAEILDPWLRPVDPGVVGELYLSGPQLARGYLGRAALTASRFVAGPGGERRYRTGDLVHLDEQGRVVYIGRGDEQLKISGYRVEPGEVQAALVQLPGVSQASVFGDEPGSVSSRLIAAVTGDDLRSESLRRRLSECLPRHLVPAQILVLEALPVTTAGKVDKAALRSLASRDQVNFDEYVAPRTPAEHALVDAFGEAFGSRVGVEADFFALGGHSLTALRLVGALTIAGWSLRVADIFTARTVRKMAALMTPLEVPEQATEQTPGPEVAELRTAAESGRDVEVPLSRAQRRLLFLHDLEGTSNAYTVPVSLTLPCAADPARWRLAWERVVQYHPALRTVFARTDDGFTAFVLAFPPRSFEVVETTPAELDAVVAQAESVAFDPFEGPPVKVTLVRTTQQDVFVLAAHHALVDETSLRTVLGDLTVALQDGDFAPAQMPWCADKTAVSRPEALERVRARLTGVPVEIELPRQRPRPDVPSHVAHRASVPVPPDRVAALRATAARGGVTELMVVQAAVASLFQALGAGDDILLGTPVSTRLPQMDRAVGFCVNTVPVRIDVSDDAHALTFNRLLERTRDAVVHALEDASVPFDEIVDAVAPPRALSRHPLFQTMVSVEEPLAEALVVDGEPAEERTPGHDAARLDVAIRYRVERSGAATLSVVLSGDLFDAVDADSLARRLANWLEETTSAPERPLCVLDARTHDEHDAAPGAVVTPLAPCVLTTVGRRAASAPDAVALVAGEERLTYAQLVARVCTTRDAMLAAGVGPEDRVALATGRGPEMVIALLATLAAGAAYLPIDVEYPDERIRFMLDDADPHLVLVDMATRGAGRGRRELVVGPGPDGPGLQGEQDEDPAAVKLADLCGSLAEPVRADRAAYVIYTSGSTGRPKGVVVPRGALDHFVNHEARVMALTRNSRFLAVTTISFDIAALEIFVPLVSGACVVLADREEVTEPARLAALARREQVTGLQATPSLWRPLLDNEPDAFSGLDAVVGGEALPRDLARRLHEVSGSVRNVYGPTEATVWATGCLVDDAAIERAVGGTVAIGEPFDDVAARILDSSLRPVPNGVPGELYLSGPQVARGYLRRPGLTATRFVADPWDTGRRMYATGDLVTRDADGTLRFVRRADDQVKVDGHRVELGDVEAGLAALPGVDHAAAVVRPDTDGRQRLLGYVVPRPGSRLDPATLRRSLSAHLPAAYVPRIVTIVDNVPLTLNGKIDRQALPEPHLESAVTHTPKTDAERAVVEAVMEALGLERVGLDDGFFELGGDSIASITLGSVLRKKGFSVTPGQVFTEPTLQALAATAEPVTPSTASGLDGTAPRRRRTRLSAADRTTIERLLEDPR